MSRLVVAVAAIAVVLHQSVMPVCAANVRRAQVVKLNRDTDDVCHHSYFQKGSVTATGLPSIEIAECNSPRSGLIHWNASSPNATFVLLSLCHQTDTCKYKFRVNATGATSLPLQLLTNELPVECQYLKGFIAVQQCSRPAECGPYNMARGLTLCAFDRYDARRNSKKDPKRKSVALRVNTRFTNWPLDELLYRVAQQGPGGNQTCHLLRNSKSCSKKKKYCTFSCVHLAPCTSYKFCPYVEPTQHTRVSHANCQHPEKHSHSWVSATTLPSIHQVERLGAVRMSGYRLTATQAFIAIEAKPLQGVANASVLGTVCAISTTSGRRHCQQISFAVPSQQTMSAFLLEGLSAADWYNVSTTLCWSCGDTDCMRLAAAHIGPHLHAPVIIVDTVPLTKSVKSQTIAFRWSDSYLGCEEQFCSYFVTVQCQGGESSRRFPISFRQDSLEIDWLGLLDGRVAPDTVLHCQVTVAIALRGNLSSMLSAEQLSISLPQYVDVELPPPPSAASASSGTVSAVHLASASAPQLSMVHIALITVFSLLTAILVVAVVLKRRCSKRNYSIPPIPSSSTVNLLAAVRKAKAIEGDDDGHDYEPVNVNAGRALPLRPGTQPPRRKRRTKRRSRNRTPPIPTTQRPIHILKNPHYSLGAGAEDIEEEDYGDSDTIYDHLFAGDIAETEKMLDHQSC